MTGGNTGHASDACANLLVQLKPRLYEDAREILETDEINVRITDLGKDTIDARDFDDATELSSFVASSPKKDTRIRIISIRSSRTIAPLQITLDLFSELCTKYAIHPDFLRVLLSFGDEPHVTEAGSSNFSAHSVGKGAIGISYELHYVEENNRGSQNPWSFRHTGIYHRHAPDFDLYIVLHPMVNSSFEKRMVQLESKTDPLSIVARRKLCQDPFQLHTILFDSYLDNWRWYFRDLGDTFSQDNDPAMTIDPAKSDAEGSFKKVQGLRNTIDFVLFAQACCVADLEVVQRLQQSHDTAFKNNSEIKSRETTLKDYVSSANALRSRVRNAIDLVGYTLTIHYQLETAKVDQDLRAMTENLYNVTEEMKGLTEDMKNLTQDTVDDSATVKLLTLVSAFYLPGSFAATIFGTNFFVFDPVSRNIRISQDFWIFVATWLPLTLITATLYVLIVYFDKRVKGQRFSWSLSRARKKTRSEKHVSTPS